MAMRVTAVKLVMKLIANSPSAAKAAQTEMDRKAGPALLNGQDLTPLNFVWTCVVSLTV